MFEMRPFNHNHRNTLSGYNPFQEMENLERSFFNEPFRFFGNDALAAFKTDITDNGSEYVLEADLPGFDKKDIHLDIDGDLLTIRAERNATREETDKKNNLICCERSFGAYSRQFDLSGVEADGIKAKYDNGVLKLTMPKKAIAPGNTPKRLEIE